MAIIRSSSQKSEERDNGASAPGSHTSPREAGREDLHLLGRHRRPLRRGGEGEPRQSARHRPLPGRGEDGRVPAGAAAQEAGLPHAGHRRDLLRKRLPGTDPCDRRSRQGPQLHARGLAEERLPTAGQSLPWSWKAIELTTEFVKQRRAFGQRLADFQNNKFKLAELLAEVQSVQAFMDHCVRLFNAGRLDPALGAAEAKGYRRAGPGRRRVRVVARLRRLPGGIPDLSALRRRSDFPHLRRNVGRHEDGHIAPADRPTVSRRAWRRRPSDRASPAAPRRPPSPAAAGHGPGAYRPGPRPPLLAA